MAENSEQRNSPMPRILGWHWFIDLAGCNTIPSRAEELEAIMVASAERAGATIVEKCFHEFSPHGLTGVLVIAESHFAVHTWPEYRAVCVDIFSCTQAIHIDGAVEVLRTGLGATTANVRCETRQPGA
jgi:S-adenosylmethionine decarboxylase